jgi:hypothetical protein
LDASFSVLTLVMLRGAEEDETLRLHPRKQTEVAKLACAVPQPQKTDEATLSRAPS